MKFAVVDCETDPFLPGRFPEPFAWGFYDGTDFEWYRSVDEIAKRLRRYRGRVWAHNGGRFDFHFLASHLNPGALTVINGRLVRARLGNASLRDSFALLPVPLASYQKTEIDYGLFEAGVRERHMDEIVAYLRDDCVFLHELLSRYYESYPDALTLAGSALKVWREMGGRVDRTNRTHYEWIRPYYFGGRVEALRKGVHRGRWDVADIKSAYPFAMLHRHPVGRPRVLKRVPGERWSQCFLDVECNPRAAFPWRSERGAVTYPDRQGRYRVTGWEWMAAEATGSLRGAAIRKVLFFPETIDFGPYVERFFAEKAACEARNDTAGRTIAKLYLNALYGKWAAAPHEYRIWRLGEWGETAAPTERLHWRAGDLFGGRQLYSAPLPESRMRYYNLATAASVTGFVRAYLWLALNGCSEPYYCDTDSVIAHDASALRYGDRLGEWELEARPDELAIGGKKLYAYWRQGTALKARSKGVKLSPSEIRAVAGGERIVYRPDVPTFSLTTGRNFINREVRRT